MRWGAFQISVLCLILLSIGILLILKAINRDGKSLRRMLPVVFLLAIPLWFFSRPVKPPEIRFHPSELEEWNTNLPPGTAVLRVGQSIEDVERVLGCPAGKYGNPEYATSPLRRSAHPMDYRPLEQSLIGSTHQFWEDDAVIIDCTFDKDGGLLRWEATSKLIVFERSLYVIQLSRWLGLE
jgi:hypothetical protein